MKQILQHYRRACHTNKGTQYSLVELTWFVANRYNRFEGNNERRQCVEHVDIST